MRLDPLIRELRHYLGLQRVERDGKLHVLARQLRAGIVIGEFQLQHLGIADVHADYSVLKALYECARAQLQLITCR